MAIHELNREFKAKYCADGANPFEAINAWVDDAIGAYDANHGLLSGAESLNAALECGLPDDLVRRIPISDAHSNYVNRYVDLAMREVDDERIRRAVKSSIFISLRRESLTAVTLDDLSEGERSRVRVLCRMIWNNFYPKKGETPYVYQEEQRREG